MKAMIERQPSSGSSQSRAACLPVAPLLLSPSPSSCQSQPCHTMLKPRWLRRDAERDRPSEP